MRLCECCPADDTHRTTFRDEVKVREVPVDMEVAGSRTDRHEAQVAIPGSRDAAGYFFFGADQADYVPTVAGWFPI